MGEACRTGKQIDGWLHECGMDGYGKVSIWCDKQAGRRATKTNHEEQKIATFTRKSAIFASQIRSVDLHPVNTGQFTRTQPSWLRGSPNSSNEVNKLAVECVQLLRHQDVSSRHCCIERYELFTTCRVLYHCHLVSLQLPCSVPAKASAPPPQL